MKKCNGTGLVLKICETKNNVWKKYELSIQNGIDNCAEIIKIKPDFANLNNRLKCRKPVFMRASGICFVSAKYCYITHELRLHQNDRCKRFTPV